MNVAPPENVMARDEAGVATRGKNDYAKAKQRVLAYRIAFYTT